MTDEPLERLLASLDRPFAPRRAFADELLVRLEAEAEVPRAQPALAAVWRALGFVVAALLAVTIGLGIASLVTALRPATQPVDLSIDKVTPVGGRPGAIAFGEGGLWVASISTGTIAKIDPQNASILSTVNVGGTASSLGIGAGSIWVSDELANVVRRVDPQRNAVVASITVEQGPYGIVVAAGSVWVTHLSGVVSRIDPSTNTVVATIHLTGGGLAQRAAFAAGSLWVTSTANAAVYRIDPATNVAVKIDIAPGPLGIAAGGDAVWVAHTSESGPGLASKIDPRTNAVVATVPVGRGANGIVIDRGNVWVANQLDNTVTRINAATATPIGEPITVDRGPAGLAVAAGALWIVHNETGTVGRIRLP
jgi:DNA-binding beta-propeller fold protein YncE